jgi:hypothetical protein
MWMQLPCHATARQHGESPASHVARRKAPGLRLPVQKEKCRSVCSKCKQTGKRYSMLFIDQS